MKKRRPLTLAGLLMTVLLAGCDSGEDDKNTARAVAWLEDTARLSKLPYGWHYGAVRPLGSDGIEMDIHMASDDQENKMRALSQMKRFAAVQPACPKNDAEVWTFLSGHQKIWLNVLGVGGKRLTRGSCWH